MKRSYNNTEEKNFNSFGFDVLNSNEMLKVRGGEDVRPRTRDKDVFDLENE